MYAYFLCYLLIEGAVARVSSTLQKCCNDIHNGAVARASSILLCCNEIHNGAMACVSCILQKCCNEIHMELWHGCLVYCRSAVMRYIWSCGMGV